MLNKAVLSGSGFNMTFLRESYAQKSIHKRLRKMGTKKLTIDSPHDPIRRLCPLRGRRQALWRHQLPCPACSWRSSTRVPRLWYVPPTPFSLPLPAFLPTVLLSLSVYRYTVRSGLPTAIPLHPRFYNLQKPHHHFDRVRRSHVVWRACHWAHPCRFRVDGRLVRDCRLVRHLYPVSGLEVPLEAGMAGGAAFNSGYLWMAFNCLASAAYVGFTSQQL